jgi:hypothetical protein
MCKWLAPFFLILVAFLPKIASTPLAKPIFVRILEAKSQGKIEIGSLSLSWFGPQKFEQVRWSRDTINGTVENLQMEAPFWSFSRPLSLEKLVGQGTLDLGQVECQSLLNKTAPSIQLNAWFSPIAFRMDRGLVEVGRTDVLLADAIRVCAWGKIDLIHDQVQIVLGLPAETLQKSFGMVDLPENYVLKVPIKGSTKDPEIAMGPAAVEIAAVIASRQISKESFLGTLANLLSKPKEDQDVPPAKRPFPWEQSLINQDI